MSWRDEAVPVSAESWRSAAVAAPKHSTASMREARNNVDNIDNVDEARADAPWYDTAAESALGGMGSIAMGLAPAARGLLQIGADQTRRFAPVPGAAGLVPTAEESYLHGHDEQANAQQTAEEDSPTGAGYVGPILANAATLGLGGASQAGKLALSRPDVIARAAQGIKAAVPVGALTSGISGFLGGESGDTGDRLAQGGESALLGGAVAGGLGGAGAAAGPLAARAAQAVGRGARGAGSIALTGAAKLAPKAPMAAGAAIGGHLGGMPGAAAGGYIGDQLGSGMGKAAAAKLQSMALRLSPEAAPTASAAPEPPQFGIPRPDFELPEGPPVVGAQPPASPSPSPSLSLSPELTPRAQPPPLPPEAMPTRRVRPTDIVDSTDLAPEQAQQVRQQLNTGAVPSEIAQTTGLDKQAVNDVAQQSRTEGQSIGLEMPKDGRGPSGAPSPSPSPSPSSNAPDLDAQAAGAQRAMGEVSQNPWYQMLAQHSPPAAPTGSAYGVTSSGPSLEAEVRASQARGEPLAAIAKRLKVPQNAIAAYFKGNALGF